MNNNSSFIDFGSFSKLRTLFNSKDFKPQKICSLDLSEQKAISIPSQRVFELLTNITHLNLHNNRIDKFQYKIILKNCQQLEYLDLSMNQISSTDDIIHLSKLSNFKELVLNDNPISNKLPYFSLLKCLIFPPQIEKPEMVKILTSTYDHVTLLKSWELAKEKLKNEVEIDYLKKVTQICPERKIGEFKKLRYLNKRGITIEDVIIITDNKLKLNDIFQNQLEKKIFVKEQKILAKEAKRKQLEQTPMESKTMSIFLCNGKVRRKNNKTHHQYLQNYMKGYKSNVERQIFENKPQNKVDVGNFDSHNPEPKSFIVKNVEKNSELRFSHWSKNIQSAKDLKPFNISISKMKRLEKEVQGEKLKNASKFEPIPIDMRKKRISLGLENDNFYEIVDDANLAHKSVKEINELIPGIDFKTKNEIKKKLKTLNLRGFNAEIHTSSEEEPEFYEKIDTDDEEQMVADVIAKQDSNRESYQNLENTKNFVESVQSINDINSMQQLNMNFENVSSNLKNAAPTIGELQRVATEFKDLFTTESNSPKNNGESTSAIMLKRINTTKPTSFAQVVKTIHPLQQNFGTSIDNFVENRPVTAPNKLVSKFQSNLINSFQKQGNLQDNFSQKVLQVANPKSSVSMKDKLNSKKDYKNYLSKEFTTEIISDTVRWNQSGASSKITEINPTRAQTAKTGLDNRASTALTINSTNKLKGSDCVLDFYDMMGEGEEVEEKKKNENLEENEKNDESGKVIELKKILKINEDNDLVLNTENNNSKEEENAKKKLAHEIREPLENPHIIFAPAIKFDQTKKAKKIRAMIKETFNLENKLYFNFLRKQNKDKNQAKQEASTTKQNNQLKSSRAKSAHNLKNFNHRASSLASIKEIEKLQKESKELLNRNNFYKSYCKSYSISAVGNRKLFTPDPNFKNNSEAIVIGSTKHNFKEKRHFRINIDDMLPGALEGIPDHLRIDLKNNPEKMKEIYGVIDMLEEGDALIHNANEVSKTMEIKSHQKIEKKEFQTRNLSYKDLFELLNKYFPDKKYGGKDNMEFRDLFNKINTYPDNPPQLTLQEIDLKLNNKQTSDKDRLRLQGYRILLQSQLAKSKVSSEVLWKRALEKEFKGAEHDAILAAYYLRMLKYKTPSKSVKSFLNRMMKNQNNQKLLPATKVNDKFYNKKDFQLSAFWNDYHPKKFCDDLIASVNSKHERTYPKDEEAQGSNHNFDLHNQIIIENFESVCPRKDPPFIFDEEYEKIMKRGYNTINLNDKKNIEEQMINYAQNFREKLLKSEQLNESVTKIMQKIPKKLEEFWEELSRVHENTYDKNFVMKKYLKYFISQFQLNQKTVGFI